MSNITPDPLPQGTLVGMLQCCCEVGDIESATRILDQMRSLDMEISENIYAALITGRCGLGVVWREVFVVSRTLSPW